MLDEKIQMGLILNGLRSDISDALKQRSDIDDMKSMITWARKLESIYYKHKTISPILASMETSSFRESSRSQGNNFSRKRCPQCNFDGNFDSKGSSKQFLDSVSDHETEMNAYETD